jgi:hypothetical protein
VYITLSGVPLPPQASILLGVFAFGLSVGAEYLVPALPEEWQDGTAISNFLDRVSGLNDEVYKTVQTIPSDSVVTPDWHIAKNTITGEILTPATSQPLTTVTQFSSPEDLSSSSLEYPVESDGDSNSIQPTQSTYPEPSEVSEPSTSTGVQNYSWPSESVEGHIMTTEEIFKVNGYPAVEETATIDPNVDSDPSGGDPYIFFYAQLPSGLASGTVVTLNVSIIDGVNAPLLLPTVTYTIDNTPPTSRVSSLPAVSSTSVPVSWSGQDDPLGNSGIAFYNVYVSDDNGPSTLWQAQTTATSATFTGQVGHTYSFYSVATDNAGNVEFAPTSAQATTTVQDFSLSQSTVSPSQASVSSGGTTSFTLQARDASGNNETTGGLTVAFSLGGSTGGQGTFGAVKDNGDGTYSATFTGTMSGANTVVASIDGSPVTSTPPSITVTPGPASPTNSVVTLVSNDVQSGSTTTINFQARDAAGNDLTSGGLDVAFALGNPSANTGAITDFTDNNNGTYSATFTGVIAGGNTITATIAGAPVTSTASVTVTPGPVSLSKSVLSVSSPAVQLGGVTTITLQARDAAGNDLTSGGLSVAATLSSASGGRGTLSTFTDNRNGTYSATFTGSADGSNTITPTIGGVPMTSTVPITVSGAAASTSKSTLKGSAASVASGTPVTVTLQAKDAKGNAETAGGLTVAFELTSPKGGQGTFGPVVDHGNGTYTATFTGTLVGSNAITATIDGSKVTSVAPTVKVIPGAVSFAASSISVSLATVKAGTGISVTLQAKDAAGNKETTGGLIVTFSLGSGAGKGTFGPVKDNKNGTYTAIFTGSLVGTNTITAKIGGQPVTSVPPAITVVPGAASPAKSLVSLSSGSVVAGSSITVTLQAIDLKGNLETSGGLTVAFKLGSTKGAQGTFSKVTDNKNGTYSATFTGTVAGSNTITATIGGAVVTTAVPSITVTPGTVSLAKSVVLLSATSVAPGKSITVTLQAEDAYGNKLTQSGLIIAFALASMTGGLGTFGSVSDNGNGTYTATLTATVAGSNNIVAQINSQALTSKPVAVKVT